MITQARCVTKLYEKEAKQYEDFARVNFKVTSLDIQFQATFAIHFLFIFLFHYQIRQCESKKMKQLLELAQRKKASLVQEREGGKSIKGRETT